MDEVLGDFYVQALQTFVDNNIVIAAYTRYRAAMIDLFEAVWHDVRKLP